MSELMETIMLICFGCSWPLSLMKNIKSKSCKGMSLSFTLMIITGYIAGITAKVLDGNYSFVLVAYIINLMMVSANVVIYFYNKNLDAKRNAIA
ncbi:MAG: hypothetical protein J6L69_00375 [Lachnospiraceae bacterium]|nr:hypothetical protein [Lachnospiraceae bacterium]